MTIKESLLRIVKSMSDFSSKTNIIAINTSILASKLSEGAGAKFMVLANEVQEMSTQSKEKLTEIADLVEQVSNLSKLINIAGGVRMLLMKMLNAKTLGDTALMTETGRDIRNRLDTIGSSYITNDTPNCLKIFAEIKEDCTAYIHLLDTATHEVLFQHAQEIIGKINALIAEYEQY